MDRILVGLDASPRAEDVLETAVELARRTGGRLILFRAVGVPHEIPVEAYTMTPASLADLLEREAKSYLDRITSALPAGLVLETPQLDLTESGDSFQTNEVIDVVLQHGLGPVNRLYANGHDLASPLLSPLFGDFSGGWPPTLLTAGTRDLFLSNAVRMLHRLRDAGSAVELLVYEAMPHGGFFGTPEDQRVRRDVQRFTQRCWDAA